MTPSDGTTATTAQPAKLVYKRRDEVEAERKANKEKAGEAEGESKEGEAEGGAKKEGGRGRHQRNNKNRDGPARYKSKPRGEGEEEEDFEEPKFTSAYQEFTAGYWRHYKKNKIVITGETVVPPMPNPLLEAPAEVVYHKL